MNLESVRALLLEINVAWKGMRELESDRQRDVLVRKKRCPGPWWVGSHDVSRFAVVSATKVTIFFQLPPASHVSVVFSSACSSIPTAMTHTTAIILGLLLLVSSASTFTAPTSRAYTPFTVQAASAGSSLDIDAPEENEDNSAPRSMSRRSAASRFGSLASAFAATFNGILSSPAAVSAVDEVAEPEGRLIEFQVANLDGPDGANSGTIVIKMRPDWAPKGVQRFEVSAFIHPQWR